MSARLADAGGGRSWQSNVKGCRRARDCRAAWILRCRIDPPGLLNLNRQGRLAIGTEDRRKWSVLQVGVRGVIAREKAEPVPSAHDEFWHQRHEKPRRGAKLE